MALPEAFRGPIAEIVDALVRGGFDELDADRRSGRVGAVDLRRAVNECGCTLVELPDDAYELAEAAQVTTRPGEWWIVVPMWTAEEGRSDLSLELSAIPTREGHRFEVLDLHVL